MAEVEEDEDEGDDSLEAADGETFCLYSPGLVAIGNAHPDVVDESATLASIKQPECKYKLGLPPEVICRRLSNLQLETVSMASQRFEQFLPDGSRAGFFLGDGAGMGKGRQIGGLIYENWVRGRRKAVWFSASSGLHYDAERDIGDLGALKYIKLHRLDQYGYGSLAFDSGVLFSTYSMLVSTSASDGTARLDQIVEWFGGERFDGLICFDEAHKAKHGEHHNRKGRLVKGTITAAAVRELQRRLPLARVVYISATAATEPHHLAYMPRLGLWGQGASLKDFPALLKMCSQGGWGAMEILCLEMKMRGMFLSRTLSYRHPETPAQFVIEKLPLTDAQIQVYQKSVGFFQRLLPLLGAALAEVKEAGYAAKKSCGPYYWGAHQRFFKMVCIACKTDHIVELVQRLVDEGNQVVMSLQGTGEAYQERTDLRQVGEGELGEDMMDKAPHQLLAGTVMYLFPPIVAKDREKAREEKPQLFEQQKRLLEEIRELVLPDNPLDDLKFKLGGPEKVAELTGRKQMVIIEGGKKALKSRAQYLGCSSDEVNLHERDLFQKGQKLICIISDAASSGISLQADRNCPVDPVTGKVRRRHHVTMELCWSADKSVQQLGRSHRSNQVSAPFYHLIVSNVAGENRFASAVAKRLQSLGALTNGDRRSVVSNMAEFDLDNQYGISGLKEMLELLAGEVLVTAEKLASPEPDMMRNLLAEEGLEDLSDGLLLEHTRRVFQEMRADLMAVELLDRKKNKKVPVARFLNRILGVEPARQNRLFKLFCLHVDAEIAKARKNGTFVEAIGQMGKDYESVRIIEGPKVAYNHPETQAETLYYRFQMDKGAAWAKAVAHLEQEPGFFNGFWRSKNAQIGRNGDKYLVLATESPPGSGAERNAMGAGGRLVKGKRNVRFRMMRPHNAHARDMNLEELQDKYTFVRFQHHEEERKKLEAEWNKAYDRARTAGGNNGRFEEAHFLAGSLTCIWPLVQTVVFKRKKQLKICRIKETTDTGRQVIGLHIREDHDLADILQRLESGDLPADSAGRDVDPDILEEFTTGWADMMQKKEEKKQKDGPPKKPGGGPKKEAKRKRKFERFQRPELPLAEEEVAQLEQSGLWEKLELPPVVDPEAYEVPVSPDAEAALVAVPTRPRWRLSSARRGPVLEVRRRGSVSGGNEAGGSVSGEGSRAQEGTGREAEGNGNGRATEVPVRTEGEGAADQGVNGPEGPAPGQSEGAPGARSSSRPVPVATSSEARPSSTAQDTGGPARTGVPGVRRNEGTTAGPSGSARAEQEAGSDVLSTPVVDREEGAAAGPSGTARAVIR